jgi:plasmid stability protein
MQTAWKYAHSMKNLQIRNVPDDVHRLLKARAAMEGRSLSEYALTELRRSLERPSRQELLARVRERGPAEEVDVVEVLRKERDAR